ENRGWIEAAGLERATVTRDLLDLLGETVERSRHERGQTVRDGAPHALRTVDRVQQQRARWADGRRPDADVGNREVATRVGELLARPSAEHDLERLVEDRARLVDRYAEHAVLRELVAAPDADLDPAPGRVIEQRDPLGEAQRVREGEIDHGGADLHAPGAA